MPTCRPCRSSSRRPIACGASAWGSWAWPTSCTAWACATVPKRGRSWPGRSWSLCASTPCAPASSWPASAARSRPSAAVSTTRRISSGRLPARSRPTATTGAARRWTGRPSPPGSRRTASATAPRIPSPRPAPSRPWPTVKVTVASRSLPWPTSATSTTPGATWSYSTPARSSSRRCGGPGWRRRPSAGWWSRSVWRGAARTCRSCRRSCGGCTSSAAT